LQHGTNGRISTDDRREVMAEQDAPVVQIEPARPGQAKHRPQTAPTAAANPQTGMDLGVIFRTMAAQT
jgi:hypothetical protein